MTRDARAFNWDSIPVKTGTSADSAAGANPTTLTVPAGKRWLFYSARFALVTDATVANRTVEFYCIPDGVDFINFTVSTTAQTASTTRYYIITPPKAVGETLLGGTTYIMGWGANTYFFELSAGATITFNIANKQVGDDAGVVKYYYKEVPA